jgi:hypothetical protein
VHGFLTGQRLRSGRVKVVGETMLKVDGGIDVASFFNWAVDFVSGYHCLIGGM